MLFGKTARQIVRPLLKVAHAVVRKPAQRIKTPLAAVTLIPLVIGQQTVWPFVTLVVSVTFAATRLIHLSRLGGLTLTPARRFIPLPFGGTAQSKEIRRQIKRDKPLGIFVGGIPNVGVRATSNVGFRPLCLTPRQPKPPFAVVTAQTP